MAELVVQYKVKDPSVHWYDYWLINIKPWKDQGCVVETMHSDAYWSPYLWVIREKR